MIALLALAGLSACNPTRRLASGESLLTQQRVSVEAEKGANVELDEDDLQAVLRQRPNRRVLLLRFHLSVFNSVNPERQLKAHQRNKVKVERKIKRKLKRGKELTSRDLREMRADTLGWRDWLTNTVGEAPVVFDSTQAEKSVLQLQTVLAKNGYFNADVNYKVRYNRSMKKVKMLTYTVRPKQPYIIDSIGYTIRDEGIARRSDFIGATTLIKPGQRFSVDLLDQERARIAEYLNNRGYQSFTKDFITYTADSTLGNNRVKIDMVIRRPQTPVQINDSITFVDHQRFFIGKIFIHADYDATDREYVPTDTLHTDAMGDIYILYRGELNIKPELLLHLVEFRPGDLYQKDRIDKTYRRIVQLPMVRSLTISMNPNDDSNIRVLNCDVLITQMKHQFISAESGMTHRDGLFGLSGSVNFSHRNMFRGAEFGRLRLTGAVEAQQPLTLTQNEEITRADLADNIRFNTFEIGPELTLNFNRFFPLKMTRFTRSNAPQTTLSAAFNYQDRPDYKRQLYQFRYSVNFIENVEKGSRIFWDIWDLSTIKIEKSDAFNVLLERLNDVFLSTSYRDHLISAGRIGWQLNTQKPQLQKKYLFNRISFEAAGNLPRLAFGLSGATQDENGSYTLGGIRFAQYFKIENDFRYYRRIDEKNATAIRLHAGSGIPGANLNVLPFEKSYFAGGANGIRAWRPRTLGPGSYRDTTALVTYNNIGEIIIEASAEYRFDLTGTIEGALFLDVGNIWLLKEEETRPGSGFKVDQFLGEMAWSSGLGLRFDFDFFLLRLDLAVQLKDPAKIPGERWAWQPKDQYNLLVERIQNEVPGAYVPPINFNLGIGYPF